MACVRRLAPAVIALSSACWLTASLSRAQAPAPGVYHSDPQHLWNRLHEALFVRHDAAGREYGRDRLEPLLWRRSKHLLHGASHERLLSTLDAFLRDGGDRPIVSPRHRAMLQRDLWLVFSWLEHSHDEFYGFGGTAGDWIAARERLRGPLAAAIGRLALDAREIARLPDTYADAVASRAFAPLFDAAHPDRPYLPPGLFAAGGPWVPIGRGHELIAPAHVLTDNPFTNSVFLVFLKLPGGRAVTRAFVERLAAFEGPLYVRSAGGQQAEYPYFNPSIPQFPAGTEVALVRRALLVTAAGELAVSPIAESIQVRRYRDVAALASPDAFLLATLVTDRTRASQTAFELTLSRRRLFAGQAGGLADEPGDAILTGFSTHGVDAFEEGHVARLSDAEVRSVRSRMCITCHPLPGVFSFNTFAQNFSATPERKGSRLAVAAVEDVLASGMRWKRRRPDWLLLRRLMTGTAKPNRALLLQPDHPIRAGVSQE